MRINKLEKLKRLTDENGIIAALAVDQRGALRKLLGEKADDQALADFKKLTAEELTADVSAILLDPEYGLSAAEARKEGVGLILAYEKTGYDAADQRRLPDLLPQFSVKILKELGADGIKLLIYYDVDQPEEVNLAKQAFVERVGSECAAEDVAFFLEILTFDEKILDTGSPAYSKMKPRKVLEAMRIFGHPDYRVDVLKVEVPVNMAYVEGFGAEEALWSRQEAAEIFKKQSDLAEVPYIFLSAGVSAELFQQTLVFAKEAGAEFHGVLCGRANWRGGAEAFRTNGIDNARTWLAAEGRENIQALDLVLKQTATAIDLPQ
ncbi:tagatose 1,6-diphosphate aldolase [Listeria costaricensis]|uniref:tagatose 1,6-diphosphate aldolase n=1 Tax=Listeria costaricensis TaxID=2026604 RepID=UPI000C068CD7|nr:tagatose 1,6-diphosphate aldolase [Listeria costaricensis]